MPSTTEREILSRLASLRLPAMPQILLQLLEMCRNDAVGIPELAALISRDAGMTSRIFGVAGSPAFCRARVPPRLDQALLTIGLNMVKTLLISESVLHVFGSFSPAGTVDLRRFWASSLSAAIAAREIAHRIGYARSDEAYLAGLLHDVGRLALLAADAKQYARHFYASDDGCLCAAEKEIFQVSHPEVGAWIADQWALDSFIADSIRYHHEPQARLRFTHPLIRIVCLARLLCSRPPGDAGAMAAAHLCGLAPEDLDRISALAQDEVKRVAEHLGVDLSGASDGDPPTTQVAAAAAREELAAHMQDMVLASELGRSFGLLDKDESGPAAITRSACMLFGFADATVLTHNDNSLRGHAETGAAKYVTEYAVPLNAGGRIAEAFHTRQVIYRCADPVETTVFEEQMQRILGGACFVSIPLADSAACNGVLIGSFEASQLDAFRKRESMLHIFGEQAGKILRKTGAASRSERGIEDMEAEDYRIASRAIAHEVNNPLSIIRNYLTVLDRKLSRSEPVTTEISILHEEIDRVTELINNFAGVRSIARNMQADLGAVVHDVVALLKTSELAPASVEITLQSIDGGLAVPCDSGALKQIFLNLIKNAIEALPDGGRIRIANKGFTSQENRSYLAIVVADSGPGLPAEVLASLYAPVKSTKGETHRGLGLSIVHGLIKKIDARIYCSSGNDGTAFELLFPLSTPARTASSEIR